jgi:hypothetical protein
MKFIKKTLVSIILILILFTIYFYGFIYKHSSSKINSDLNGFCNGQPIEEFKTKLTSNPFEDEGCIEIINLYKKFDFYNYFGYSFCADYINEMGNKYMIYGYLDVSLLSKEYHSINITNTDHCYSTEYD